MAQGCEIEESITGFSFILHDYEIKKLSEQFYKDYSHD